VSVQGGYSQPAGICCRQYGNVNYLPRFVWAQAAIDADDGRMDRAMQSVETIFKMSDSMKDEPAVPGAMSRFRLIGVGTEALMDITQTALTTPKRGGCRTCSRRSILATAQERPCRESARWYFDL